MSLIDDLQGMYDATAQALHLDTSKLGALGAALAEVANASTLTFSGVTAAPVKKAGTITFQGTGLALTGDGLFVLPADQITAALCTIYRADGRPVLVISVRLAATWRFPHSFPLLANTFWTDVALKPGTGSQRLILSTGSVPEPGSGRDLVKGVAFDGTLDETAGLLGPVGWILGPAPVAFGPIEPAAGAPPAISLALATSQNGIAGLFPDLKVPLTARIESSANTGASGSGLHLTATLKWAGNPAVFEVFISGSDTSLAELSLNGPLPLPTAEDLTRYLGNESVTLHLPDGFKDSVHVGKIALGIGLGSRKLEYAKVGLTALETKTLTIVPKWVEVANISFLASVYFNDSGHNSYFLLKGTLDIGGVDLVVSAQLILTPRLSDLTVVVQLDQGDSIDLTAIAEKFGLPAGAPRILVDEFHMSASKSGTYFVRTELSEHPIGPDHDAFVLSNLIFELDYDGTHANRSLEGIVAVAGVTADLSLSQGGDSGSADGWVIDAKTGQNTPIKVGDLIADLSKKFGAQVPAPVHGLAINNVEVKYKTGTGDFFFTCEGDFTVEATPVKMTVTVDVKSDGKGQTPKKYASQFDGTIVIGPATFDVKFGTTAEDSRVSATWAAKGATLNFADVAHAFGLHDIAGISGNLALNAASFSYDFTTKSLSLSADVASKGKLPIGNLSYDVDLRLVVNSGIDPTTKARTVSAHFESDLVIGPSTFDVSFNVGTVTNVIGLWKGGVGQTLNLTDIAHKLGIPAPSDLPAGLNLGLKSASFTYDVNKHAFTLSAESTQFGDAFFVTARGTDGNLAFVFGLDAPSGGHLSNLPVIGSHLKAADVLTFQKACFLVSSGTFKDFVIPTLPSLPAPAAPASAGQQAGPTTGRPVAPIARGASLQLSPGLSLAAVMTFSGGSADPRVSNLASIVGQPTLLLQVSIGASLLKIFCSLAGTVWIPAGGRNKLALSNPSVEIDITGAPPVMAVQMSGSVAFTALGMPVTATARLIISEVEAQVACVIGADGSRMHVPVLGELPVAKLGVEMGVFFEPPGVDVGVQGQLTIGQQARAFAVVLEMVEEVPNPLYLAFYVNQANLFDVLTMFMPALSAAAAGAAVLSPGIYNKAMQVLSLVQATDLSFHWCDNVVVLPDGTVAQPGLGFSAGISIFSWSGFAQLELSAAHGVSGTCEMSAIDLRGILRVDGDGAGIKRNAPPGGGAAQAAPNLQLPSHQPKGQSVWIVPPGGATFAVNTVGPNYLHANWKISLFDAVRQSADVTVTATGFTFVINFQAGSVARFSLSCVLDGKALAFSASATLVLQVSGSVGPIHVAGINVGSISLPNVSVNAGLSISLNKSSFSLGLHGSFQFQSMSLSVPEVDFSTAPKSVAELPGLMLRAIQQKADEIFKSLVGNVDKWADLVGRGVVTGVTDMADTLHKAYNVSAQDAARLMSVGKQSAETITSGLKSAYKQTNAQVATLLKGAGYTTQQITQTFKNIGVSADETVNILEHTLGVGANDAVNAIKGAFTHTHVDTAVTPHIDTTQPPHGDVNTPHGDTTQPPHVDTRSPHADTTQPPHGDTRSPHVDFSAGHIDRSVFGKHVDTGTHTDTGGIHVDTPSKHVDVKSVHGDTGGVHVDVKPFHTDTPAVHVDKSPVHTDTNV